MPLSPNPRARNEDKAGNAHTEEMPTCEQRYLCEAAMEVDAEGDGVRCKQRRQGGRDNGEQTEDCEDQVAAEEGPIERVIRVAGGLRDEHCAIFACLEVSCGSGSRGIDFGEGDGA